MKATTEKENHLFSIFCGMFLMYIIYLSIYPQLSDEMSDYGGHIYQYLPMFEQGVIRGWQTVPYFLWHAVVLLLKNVFLIPLMPAVAYCSCLFEMVAYIAYYWIVRKTFKNTVGKTCNSQSAFFALCLCLVQGYYFPWTDISMDGYLGVFSMNPWHNPTQMCVLGLSLVIFVLVCDLLGIVSQKNYVVQYFQVNQGSKRYYVLLTVLLLLSTIAKPTFAEMFIPAVALFMLTELIIRIYKKADDCKEYFKSCLKMLVCSVPSLLYIGSSFINYFVIGDNHYGDTSVTVTSWMKVWSLFSDNIYLALLFGMAFPIYVIIIDPKFFAGNVIGRLGALGYACGLLEAGFLAESGDKIGHADFLWPMMSGMAVLWLAAFIRMIMLEKTAEDGKVRRILINIGWIIFAGHVLCGVIYWKTLVG